MDNKLEMSVNRIIQRIYLQSKIKNEAEIYLKDKLSGNFEGTEKEQLWIKRIEIIKNEYILGLLSKSQYYFHISFIVHNVIHDSKWTNGEYDQYLDPINNKIKEIEKKHGLKENEYWHRNKGPKEWCDLNKIYEDKLNELYILLLAEYNCNDIKDTYINHQTEYKRLVNKGRLDIIGHNKSPILPEILLTYKKEFEKCKRSKAYYSAIIMAGATLETYLMIICNKNINKLKPYIVQYNEGRNKKVSSNPADWDLNVLLVLCEISSLIPLVKINDKISISVTDIGGIIRQARNLVHPGRHLKSAENLVEENNFKDIEAYYYILEYVFDSLNGLTTAST